MDGVDAVPPSCVIISQQAFQLTFLTAAAMPAPVSRDGEARRLTGAGIAAAVRHVSWKAC